MSRQTIYVNIDNEVLTLDDAASLLGCEHNRLLNLLNGNEDGFGWQGFKCIKRVGKMGTRRGTVIIRASDHRRWDSIKAVVKELGINKQHAEDAIRKEQKFEFDGNTYFAPSYVKRTRVLSKPMNKKADIIKLGTQSETKTLDRQPEAKQNVGKMIKEAVEQKVKEITTEQKCFKMLQELAIERIKNTEYDKASKVLNALALLKN